MPKFSEFLRGLSPKELITEKEAKTSPDIRPKEYFEDINEYLQSLDEEVLKDLLFYLDAQQRTENSFTDMASLKKEIKRSNSGHQFDSDYEAAKKTWASAKEDLSAYKLTDELSELAPNEINDNTPGHPILKVIRKLNLGTLRQAERDLLKEKVEGILRISKDHKKAA